MFGVVNVLLVGDWGLISVRTELLGDEKVKFAFAFTLLALELVVIIWFATE